MKLRLAHDWKLDSDSTSFGLQFAHSISHLSL